MAIRKGRTVRDLADYQSATQRVANLRYAVAIYGKGIAIARLPFAGSVLA